MTYIRHPLLIMLCLVTAASAVLMVTGSESTQRYVDGPMLVLICTAYGLACFSILTRTKFVLWTILGAGLLATMAGDAGLYAWIFTSRQWPGVAPHAHTVLAIVRSLLLVGGSFVVIGLAREKWVLDHADRRDVQQAKRQVRQNAQQEVLDRTSLVLARRGEKLSDAGVVLDDRRTAMDTERHDMDDERALDHQEGEKHE